MNLSTWSFASAVVLGQAFWCSNAQAAITCTSSATGVTGIYTSSANLDLTGSLTINCSRLSTDSATATYYVGLDQGEPPAGRNMTVQGGTTLLAWTIYRNLPATGGIWTSGTSRPPGSTSNGGLTLSVSFVGSALTWSTSIPYYFRTASGQTGKPVGVYDDTPMFSVKTSSGGTTLSTSTFVVNVSILSQCRFSTSPTALNLAYTSFASSATTGSNSFGLTCTLNTPYTLTLNGGTLTTVSTSASTLGLNYSLILPITSGTGSAFEKTYAVNGTVGSGQSGNCITSTCTQTISTHFVQVNY